MCDTCGCNLTPGNKHLAFKPVAKGATAVSVLKGLLAKNDDQAAHNREHFDKRGILAINLMSSPGSGKTALLEATLVALKDEFTCAVIEGDLETENDAERIRAKGVQAHQIVTGTACHLDAHLVHDALHHMTLDGVDILFIENVGNLVCPASFDLGQHLNVTLLSVTEGDDKPAKYPVMFRAADAMLLTKTDLLAVLDDFDPDKAEAHLRNLANPAPVMRLSARKELNMEAWYAWLREQLATQLARVAQGQSRRPKIHALEFDRTVKILNVCGGHERSITHAGLRGALPKWIELVPGPGCPVCVCPEEVVYQAMQLALQDRCILVAFGDMLRVPVNVKKGEVRSLAEAQAAGADIRPIASPLDARKIALDNPERPVVFFAAGFETTTAPVAAMLAEGIPTNLSILLSGRLTWPAVAMLLDSGTPGFDALVAPGHVSTIMGPEEWSFVVDRHEIPAAVAGFGTESLLASFYSVLRQLKTGERFLDNCYREVAHPGGNPTARRMLEQTLDVVDANWRGIGIIPNSGYALKPAFAKHDALLLYPDHSDPTRRRAGEMPPGCDCAQVVLGKIYPNQCRIYGLACTPRNPVGPCMVSDEGACRIWWAGGVRVVADA